MRKGRPASPHAGLLLRPPDPQKLSGLYQLTPSFPIGRFSFHSGQGEKKGGGEKRRGRASSDSQIIVWQISKCTFHGSAASRALPFAVCIIILEGAHDLNILKLINASRISHSLKGPLESRTAVWRNKSKAVDEEVPCSPWGLGNPGWNSSLSAGKKAQVARSSRNLGTATGLTPRRKVKRKLYGN